MLSGCCLRGDGSGDKETGGRGVRGPGAPRAPQPAPQTMAGGARAGEGASGDARAPAVPGLSRLRQWLRLGPLRLQQPRGAGEGGSLPVLSRPGAGAGSSRNNACPGHPDIPPPARAAWRNHHQPPSTCPPPAARGGRPGAARHGRVGVRPRGTCVGTGRVLQAGMVPCVRARRQPVPAPAPARRQREMRGRSGSPGVTPAALPGGSGAGVLGARPPARAAATRHGCHSQEAQTLSRDFTAALGRMSHPGRGARRQPATRPPAPAPRGGPLAPREPGGDPGVQAVLPPPPRWPAPSRRGAVVAAALAPAGRGGGTAEGQGAGQPPCPPRAVGWGPSGPVALKQHVPGACGGSWRGRGGGGGQRSCPLKEASSKQRQKETVRREKRINRAPRPGRRGASGAGPDPLGAALLAPAEPPQSCCSAGASPARPWP